MKIQKMKIQKMKITEIFGAIGNVISFLQENAENFQMRVTFPDARDT